MLAKLLCPLRLLSALLILSYFFCSLWVAYSSQIITFLERSYDWFIWTAVPLFF